ncbi:hypothetical protein [Deferribacter abyssi]|uniref:hypothetical protein n=1 Tax=Deferribacter abyssi TaxID=213806 RepID=UPI003C280C1F
MTKRMKVYVSLELAYGILKALSNHFGKLKNTVSLINNASNLVEKRLLSKQIEICRKKLLQLDPPIGNGFAQLMIVLELLSFATVILQESKLPYEKQILRRLNLARGQLANILIHADEVFLNHGIKQCDEYLKQLKCV